ncbi:MAG: hypothetical protein WB014_06075 [Methanosarcina sp.]
MTEKRNLPSCGQSQGHMKEQLLQLIASIYILGSMLLIFFNFPDNFNSESVKRRSLRGKKSSQGAV